MNAYNDIRAAKAAMLKLAVATVLSVSTPLVLAQAGEGEADELRLAAVEALITAPPDRALPLARKVVEGDFSDELKERALFVLSQIDDPEAQEIVLSVARTSHGELRDEAVRMIGIGGNHEALAQLQAFFAEGDEGLRDAVLEAYLIADDADAVYRLALETTDARALEQVVETLAAMGAHDKLRELRGQLKISGSEVDEALIQAYAMAGDFESLHELARDGSDPERQQKAIEGLGIIGGSSADQALLEIYGAAANDNVREAALDGLLISGNDEMVLELYRGSNDKSEKKMLLEYLVIMDSDAVWDIIDQALGEDQ